MGNWATEFVLARIGKPPDRTTQKRHLVSENSGQLRRTLEPNAVRRLPIEFGSRLDADPNLFGHRNALTIETKILEGRAN